MTRHNNLGTTTNAIGLVLSALIAGGVALAQHPLQTPTPNVKRITVEERPLYGQLASGVWVMAFHEQLFFVGQKGVRSLCPDGHYDLKNGSHLGILAARIVPPWVKQGFNPQPEPPGKELFALTEKGQKLALSQGLLFFEGVGGGPRARCGDGAYSLRNGASVQIVRGVVQNAGHLEGFAP